MGLTPLGDLYPHLWDVGLCACFTAFTFPCALLPMLAWLPTNQSSEPPPPFWNNRFFLANSSKPLCRHHHGGTASISDVVRQFRSIEILQNSPGITFIFQCFGGEVDTLSPLVLNPETTGSSTLIFCVWCIHELNVAIAKFLLQIHASNGYA